MSNSTLLFLTGAPNSGKSTVAEALSLAKHVGVVISPGEWLRHLISSRDLDNPSAANDLANFASNNTNNEAHGPLVEEYLERALKTFVSASPTVLIEGYPRTVAQSQQIVRMAQRHKVAVVHLDIDLNSSKTRGQKRAREDDNTDSLDYRCEFWRENKDDILRECVPFVTTIHTDKLSVEQVTDKIVSVLKAAKLDTKMPPVKSVNASPPSSHWRSATAIETATIVQMQLRLAGCSRRCRQFCGSHPVSLDRPNMPRLLRYPYLCSLKIDGTRYFCLVRDQCLWFMNRKLCVWRGPCDPRLEEFSDTLIDGELTLDNLFIVIDVLSISGRNVMKRPIMERLSLAARLGQMMMHTAFHFRVQEYVHRTHLKLLLERANQMPFRTDGIIFQPEKLPVRLGIDYNLFKYKDAKQNTVDLLLGEDGALYCRKTSDTTENDDTVTLDVNSGVILTKVPNGSLHPDYTECVWLKPGSVAEFSPALSDMMPQADGTCATTLQWIPKRPRWDKHFPNMDWVVESILRSIADNITEAELVEYTSRPSLGRGDVPSPPQRKRQLYQ